MSTKKGSKTKKQDVIEPDVLIQFYQRIIKPLQGVDTISFLGYPCSFINGQMFAGLNQGNMFIRLAEEDRAIFLEFGDAKLFEQKPGRVLKEYVIVPPVILKSENQLNMWLKKSYRYAKSLPPKQLKRKLHDEPDVQTAPTVASIPPLKKIQRR